MKFVPHILQCGSLIKQNHLVDKLAIVVALKRDLTRRRSVNLVSVIRLKQENDEGTDFISSLFTVDKILTL